LLGKNLNKTKKKKKSQKKSYIKTSFWTRRVQK